MSPRPNSTDGDCDASPTLACSPMSFDFCPLRLTEPGDLSDVNISHATHSNKHEIKSLRQTKSPLPTRVRFQETRFITNEPPVGPTMSVLTLLANSAEAPCCWMSNGVMQEVGIGVVDGASHCRAN